ncbi:hypothetical protein GCM10007385_44100 [Tateyamaria omphalii]|uniref:sulfotransferase family 2 domain-containing protein n=1 Tax=Tateyamaria omphalii TaxID=299262 RepID=UPI00167B103F|nr:sulfotransferase family 2 domain-containing protein [Tateyamaria omphalii]GGX70278.1 hypothetical protein GCM10007385_44100 [Tateyamaria omphalii]
MPLARVGSKLVYFAHVPKCAGMSIENYLAGRFGPLALLHNKYGQSPEPERWSRTSPQHMPEAIRQDYVPDGFVDASFSVVRHPALRLRSVFLFQRDIEGRIDPETDFAPWLDQVTDDMNDPFAYDGHLRPMTDTVPKDATVFHLEDGLDPLIAWLDELSEDTDGPRQIKAINVLANRLIRMKKPPVSLTLTPQDFDRIAQLYGNDYRRFGYGTVPEPQTETCN